MKIVVKCSGVNRVFSLILQDHQRARNTNKAARKSGRPQVIADLDLDNTHGLTEIEGNY